MKRPAFGSARGAALEVLQGYDLRRGDAAELLHAALRGTDRTGQATDLVYGVIRNRTLLDRLLGRIAAIAPRNVKPAVWNVLRLGVYELIYAPKTAAYAILNEAVTLARAVGSQKDAGFVNAVLRNITRQIAIRDAHDLSEYDMKRVIRRPDGSGCVLACAVLPDPADSLDAYLHCLWSLPRWLVQEWIAVYGTDIAANVCRASNRHPSVYAWPDTRRIDAAGLAQRLAAEGVTCRHRAERGAVQCRSLGDVQSLKAFGEGLFFVQDPAAQALAAFLDPKPGDTLVDLCAAPGGKTIALALKMNDTGCILASDASAARLKRLDENISRLGLTSVDSVAETDLAAAVRGCGRVDAIILDVPCSNTGVLARRVEARYRLERGVAQTLLTRQQHLLSLAENLLRPHSRLLYSTCSIQPEENIQQIRIFLDTHPDFYLIKQKTLLPTTENAESFDHDGGFMALLARQ